LSSLPHVAKIRSSFVLREVARRVTPPVVFEAGNRPGQRTMPGPS
jgi:hypothetical protein